MPGVPQIPVTYAQWSACLDLLSEGTQDDACLDCMRQGTLAWSGGVATLFAQRLADEFNLRLTRCSDHLTRDLRQGADESLVVRAILNARQALAFLHRVAQTAAFPETLRAHLTDEVRKFAQRSQQSLEDTAKSDRSGRLLVLLRNNTLVRYDVAIAPAYAAAASVPQPLPLSAAAAVSPTGVRGRNILT